MESLPHDPSDGVLIYGLFLEGARWNMQTMALDDPFPGEHYTLFPVTHLVPRLDHVPPESVYTCPLYTTSVRLKYHSHNCVIRS